jgi:hypothetical protein
MKLKIAAIRSGSDPVGELPGGSFHRWLETPLTCPKCDVTYNLAVEWEQAIDRFFPENSRSLINLLKKAIIMGHAGDHQISHFETAGVVVKSFPATKK